jgi:2-oxoisovalerate dehydrogenase E1 component
MDTALPVGPPSLPGGIARDLNGKPVLPLQADRLYTFGHLLRETERLLLDLFGKGLLSGTTHTCIGQELCAMAVVRALDRPDDAVLSTHRNHGHFLTYSGDVLGLIAEVMGREAGVCGGRGGSQHIIHRHFHSNGVQGGMTAIGVGLARAREMAGSDGIVAVIVGDGTMGEGLLYESLNLAAVWSAPVLFVVEANGVAQTTPTRDTVGGDIAARGAAFGLPTWRVGDDDPALWHVAEEAVRAVREGRRPGFLVIDTGRLGPHSKGDDLRTPEEMDAIRARDPLARLGEQLDPALRARIETTNAAFLAEVLEAAKASPEARFTTPPTSPFAPDDEEAGDGIAWPAPANAPRSVRVALNQALRHALEHDPRVVLLGEDLHDPYGGAFKVTAGLSTDFPGRVISTPISEAAITGAGIGLALAGMRPVVEIMFADFLSLCLDQLYNHALKFPGIGAGARVPLVIRTPAGGRRGYGPTHSQSPENIFTSVPGLTVVYGSPRHDAGRLLADATLSWPHPTLFVEHKLLYGEQLVPLGYAPLPVHPEDVGTTLFPTLARRRAAAGVDLVIVTYGGMVPVVEAAAAALEEDEELEVEIVIPALLSPLPRHGLAAAVAGCPRVLIAEEAVAEFGVGAEIAASLLEAGFTGRLGRVGAPPVPIPSARSLESAVLPDAGRVVAAALRLF